MGIRDTKSGGHPAVAIPSRAPDGHLVREQPRLTMSGPDRFRWGKGSGTLLYGLERLHDAREKGYAVLVEGVATARTKGALAAR